ncbi:MAG: ABC transporter ATP-binding protein [Candidatus Tyrphobacter sp.]
MIELRDVALEIGGKPLLRDVNLTLQSGRLVALIGPNGAGKTTLLRAIAGLHPVARGSILIGGEPVHALAAAQRARHIAFLAAEETPLEALRVREVVASARYSHHRWWEWRETANDARAVSSALREVRMERMEDRIFATLSSGERRNVWIAFALAQEAPVLLLDEPTTHLDLHVAQRILALLRAQARRGKTILCALHDLNEAAAYADAIALVGNGRLLVAGPPARVLEDPIVDRTYQTRIERVRLGDGTLRLYPFGEDRALEP